MSGVPADSVDYAGRTPLFSAAFSDHVACARLLLAAGADPNRANLQYRLPLATAIRSHAHACVSLLVANGARVEYVECVSLHALAHGVARCRAAARVVAKRVCVDAAMAVWATRMDERWRPPVPIDWAAVDAHAATRTLREYAASHLMRTFASSRPLVSSATTVATSAPRQA